MERREVLKLAIGLPLAVGSLKSLADQAARTCLILDRQFDGAIADFCEAKWIYPGRVNGSFATKCAS